MVSIATHSTVISAYYVQVCLYYSSLTSPHFVVGTTVNSTQKTQPPKGWAPQVHAARKENPWVHLITVPDRSWEPILVITLWMFLKGLMFHFWYIKSEALCPDHRRQVSFYSPLRKSPAQIAWESEAMSNHSLAAPFSTCIQIRLILCPLGRRKYGDEPRDLSMADKCSTTELQLQACIVWSLGIIWLILLYDVIWSWKYSWTSHLGHFRLTTYSI